MAGFRVQSDDAAISMAVNIDIAITGDIANVDLVRAHKQLTDAYARAFAELTDRVVAARDAR